MVNFIERRYRELLCAAVVLGMAVSAWSVVLGAASPDFRGLLPYGGSEEAMYLLRTQEALLHPFTDVTNGVWSGAYAPPGLQSAGTEQLIGALLWWTHAPAPWVVFFLHVIIAPLAIPLFAALARRAGAGKARALFTAVFAFWYFVYCHRLFHPGFSLPLVLAALILLWRWYEKPSAKRAVALGVPLGFAVGVYLWSWTFLWTTTALVAAAVIADRSLPQRGALLKSLPWLAGATGIAALPAAKSLATARLLPYFAEASVRAGLAHTRLPESLPRSVATVAFAACAWWLFRKKDERRSLLPLLCALVSLAVMYNQQLVHGVVMSFSSHYIHYVSVALILLLTACVSYGKRGTAAILVGTAAVCMLAFNFRDTGGRIVAFQPPIPDSMRMQHLAPALQALDALPGGLVLTDMRTADVVASYTKQDVAFTEYSGFLLTSDEEYEKRACLSEMFSPKPVDFEHLVVHAEERLRVLRRQETQAEYERSVAAANAVCAALRAKPAADVLKDFGVGYVLWNKNERPDWSVPAAGLEQQASGSSWTLWRVRN